MAVREPYGADGENGWHAQHEARHYDPGHGASEHDAYACAYSADDYETAPPQHPHPYENDTGLIQFRSAVANGEPDAVRIDKEWRAGFTRV